MNGKIIHLILYVRDHLLIGSSEASRLFDARNYIFNKTTVAEKFKQNNKHAGTFSTNYIHSNREIKLNIVSVGRQMFSSTSAWQ